MLYALHLLDKPDMQDLRSRTRPDHKAYLSQVAERIAFAGPLLDDDGRTMIGSLLVIDFAGRDAALDWLADEPFTRAGLYGQTRVYAFENLWPQRAGHVQLPPTPAGTVAGTTVRGDENHVQTLR